MLLPLSIYIGPNAFFEANFDHMYVRAIVYDMQVTQGIPSNSYVKEASNDIIFTLYFSHTINHRAWLYASRLKIGLGSVNFVLKPTHCT